MSVWSIVFFVLAALYYAGALLEFPIFYDGNPKTRFFMKKFGGKRNWKIFLLVIATVWLVLAIVLR